MEGKFLAVILIGGGVIAMGFAYMQTKVSACVPIWKPFLAGAAILYGVLHLKS